MFKLGWQNSLWRAVVAGISFGIPVLTLAIPEWQNITLGAVAFFVLHFAEKKLIVS